MKYFDAFLKHHSRMHYAFYHFDLYAFNIVFYHSPKNTKSSQSFLRLVDFF